MFKCDPEMLQQMGNRLEHLRRSAGLTLDEVGQRCGLDPRLVSRYEKGIHWMSAEKAWALARAFEVSTDYLIAGASEGASFGQAVLQALDALAQPARRRLLLLLNIFLASAAQGEAEEGEGGSPVETPVVPPRGTTPRRV